MHDWRYATRRRAARSPPLRGTGRGVRASRCRVRRGTARLLSAGGHPGPAGADRVSRASAVDQLVAIMLVVVVPVILATLGFAWW